MKTYPRIIASLKRIADGDAALKSELELCILQSFEQWIKQSNPPNWALFQTLNGFYSYLDLLMNTTPADSDFDALFHELFFVLSQNGNSLQKSEEFSVFQEWLALFVEVYGSFLNTPQSANNVYSLTHDKTFEIDLFTIPPGGFNSFNTFFSRYIRPGERPIGAKTHPYNPPSAGNPVGPSPKEDGNAIFKNMADDKVVVV